MTLEDIMACTRGRIDSVIEGHRAHLIPNRALIGPRRPACDRLLAGVFGLTPANSRVGGLGSRVKGFSVARAIPATGLHAADRNGQRAALFDQSRNVEGSVLLGTENLFALEQKDLLLGWVLNKQVVDRCFPGELPYRNTHSLSLREAQVAASGFGAKEGEDREVPCELRISDPQSFGQKSIDRRWRSCNLVHMP